MTFDDRARPWLEWLGAVVLGVVLLNLQVTDTGDPLSSISGPAAGSVVAGITPETKAVLYAVLALVGVAIALWSVSQSLRDVLVPRFRSLGSAAALLTAAGVAGLGLDYRDGPVRTVQLVVYVTLALTVIRAVGLAVALRASGARR